jgi:hypothetical protein
LYLQPNWHSLPVDANGSLAAVQCGMVLVEWVMYFAIWPLFDVLFPCCYKKKKKKKKRERERDE